MAHLQAYEVEVVDGKATIAMADLVELRRELASAKELLEEYRFLWKEIYHVTTEAKPRGITPKSAIHLIQALLQSYFKGVD